jgi:hypothetical protein
MLAARRRAWYVYLLALHGLLVGAARRTPTTTAASPFRSRFSVDRLVRG